jgi:threonine dehydrogenase-like Zn-dependent dehydrogenase
MLLLQEGPLRWAIRLTLYEKIQAGDIDPSQVITHRVPLSEAPAAYKTFRDKNDGCIKVVLKP